MSSLRFPTDHTGFGAESNAEREEREATMAGMWTVEARPTMAEVEEEAREAAEYDDNLRFLRTVIAG